MRTITTTLYKFDELPSEKAKEKARDWWRALESQDPAWADEHCESVCAARKFIMGFSEDWTSEEEKVTSLLEATKDLKENSDGCPWTGYCADALALDAIIKACDDASSVRNVCYRVMLAMELAWNEDVASSMEAEHVDECILANDYEFLENGKKA